VALRLVVYCEKSWTLILTCTFIALVIVVMTTATAIARAIVIALITLIG
jgi:hypothetical protein